MLDALLALGARVERRLATGPMDFLLGFGWGVVAIVFASWLALR